MVFVTANPLAALVDSAISTKSSHLARAAHAQIVKTLDSPLPAFLSNHLVNMYSKLDLPSSAQLVLHLTRSRCAVTWTSLISGSVQNGRFASALVHFVNMRREGIQPNDFTLPCVFKASGSLRMFSTGKQVHAVAVKTGLIWDVVVGCSAFDMYCKTGLQDEASKMFDEIPGQEISTWYAYMSNSVLDGRPQNAIRKFIEFLRVGGEPNMITFCAFLNGCSDTSNLKLGRQLHGFVIRCRYGKDVRVMNGLIDFYGKCREVGSSEMVFDQIKQRNVVSWCSMVAMYMQNDEEEKACGVFLQARKEGIEPNYFMLSSVLRACAGLAAYELGRSVHALAAKACVEGNIFVGSALVDMYGKCGSINDSENAFEEMPEKNVVTWNAMINGYAQQGHADMALALFEEMRSGVHGVKPDNITLDCVLSACSKAGMVKMGLGIFESMRVRYGIEPGAEHYAYVVDLLGRAGLVERAYEFIHKMPIRPTISIWRALLGACRVHIKSDIERIASDNLFELDPKDSGNHVVLSNLFAAAGSIQETCGGR